MSPAPSEPPFARSGSWLWRFAKWLLFALSAIAVAGALYQFSISRWENGHYPRPGKLFDIGGLRLHINCTGAGSPTVILEAGPNDSSIIWQLVQPEIGRFTRVCSYDRAGFGWSDAPNEPRTSSNIANELASLLNRAAVAGPYVLVGHDFGTLDLRVFASRHPGQTAGMVFVDSVHPDLHRRPPFNSSTPQSLLAKASYQAMLWTVPLGVPRILGWCRATYRIPHRPPQWPALASEAIAQYCRPEAWWTEAAQATDEDGSLAATTGPFGDMPMVVLSHDPQFSEFQYFFPPALAVKAEEAWTAMQEELRGLSLRSKRIVATGSYHYVQIYRPKLVVAAVQEIVDDNRGAASFRGARETEYK